MQYRTSSSVLTLHYQGSYAGARAALLFKACLVHEKVGDVLCLLPHICALVLPIFVDELEFLQSLDDVQVVLEINNDVLGPGVQAVVEDGERLNT